jgi:solute carrier family 30 (zinc transporter), member 5/7
MHGVFLHILADTLGSVGVIISTLLYKQTGWPGFDPLASIFIAVLIFCSVVPLVRSASQDLIALFQDRNESTLRAALADISRLESVHGMSHIRFWYHSGEQDNLLGEVTLHVSPGVETTFDSVQMQAQARLASVLPHCHGVNFNVLSSN